MAGATALSLRNDGAQERVIDVLAVLGRVPTASSDTKHFKLMNKSLVYARWRVARREADCEAVYAFSPTSGIIAPDGEQTISVRYTPRVSGTFSHERYDATPARCTRARGPPLLLGSGLS